MWRVERDSERFMDQGGSTSHCPHHLRKVIRVIAEFGAAYTLTVLATFIVNISQNNMMYPVSDMSLQTLGITLNVILVRSSAKCGQQFTRFNQNERTTVVWHSSAGDTTLGTIKFVSGQTRTQDVELGMKTNDHTKHRQTLPADPILKSLNLVKPVEPSPMI